jgi:4-hydroxybenzoate polyprenyltransferase
MTAQHLAPGQASNTSAQADSDQSSPSPRAAEADTAAAISVEAEIGPEPGQVPLCVDLDGTLVKSDTLVDGICLLARTHPAELFRLPMWLAGGKARLKRELTARAPLDPASLPYNGPLVIYLREQAAAGRPLILATGADRVLAERVAGHLGLFDEVIASDNQTNLTGKRKLRLLEERFGTRGFAYVGNSRVDLPLLRQAASPMLANPAAGLQATLTRGGAPAEKVFVDRVPAARSIWRALRLHQWSKNLLLFLPRLLAHAAAGERLAQTIWAFFSFGLVASGTYIVNDLLDLAADRGHDTKRRRPFAAGDLSAAVGAVLAAILFAGGVLIAVTLAPKFLIWLLVYAAVTLAYSLYLKRLVVVDVILLSGLYTLRLVAGAAAAQVPISNWMAGFAIFFFFSLALVKRFSELENLRARGGSPGIGRGYRIEDMEQLRTLGTASAFASIVVFSLYINNPEVRHLYHHPQRLWLLTPLLIWWIARVWLRASRGEMHEDPVIFALTDRASLLAGLAIFLIAAFASI